MCFTTSRVDHLSKWNWDGDQIIHQAIVPSSRPPVGYRTGGYDIDVREFLVSERNAVLRRALDIDIKKYTKTLKGSDWALFTARSPGSFDHRAHVITEYVSECINYLPTTGLDPWQFPDETLHLKSGDCEDRALLIASLLLASGISTFNVRVALGKFRAWFGKKYEDHDHVWVMYKNESGKWEVIEPARTKALDQKTQRRKTLPGRAEYIPHFLFNDSHLWRVRHSPISADTSFRAIKRDWSSLRPEFAGWVHKSILNEALPPDICPSWVLNALNRHFTSYLWSRSLTVDDIDSPNTYDPRDHFDNGYIDEGWKLTMSRLAQFKAASITQLDTFHTAAHSIADFYAHSSYAHFANKVDGQIPNFDPQNPSSNLSTAPDYASGQNFDLTSDSFSQNTKLWNGTPNEAAAIWKGKLISGRYAQRSDSHSLIEAITYIPEKLEQSASFKQRGSLPHHNEIAVDEDTKSDAHILYSSDDYVEQYGLRYNAAVRHIRQAFQDNWNP